MRAILPGKPQAKLQALTSGLLGKHQLVAYISGNAFIVLDSPTHIVQTTYIEEEDELVAIQFDESSGKIAVCSDTCVYVYKPYGQEEGIPQWSLQCTIASKDDSDLTTTLSWGSDEDLLVGGTSLTLYTTRELGEIRWTRGLANAVKFAEFSHAATLIATVGRYDRLVKVWRRLSFQSEDQRFDYIYLPHPTVVTGIHWRRPFHKEQNLEDVLYTTCADNKIRIWVPGDPHTNDVMHLWGEIDLLESIQLRSIPGQVPSSRRYVFIIDSRALSSATEKAVQKSSGAGDNYGLDHLIAVANRNPEVCVVLDDLGNMSAWGLENISYKPRAATDIFMIAHVEWLPFHFAKHPEPLDDNVQFLNFCDTKSDTPFTILAHHFDGRLEWLNCNIDTLFSPLPQEQRLQRSAVWTGHASSIKKVIRTASGKALVSRTMKDETIVWVQRATKAGMTLHRHSTVQVKEHIHRTCLLQEGDFVIFLHHNTISLWDTRKPLAVEVARCSYQLEGKPLCLILIPEIEANIGHVHVATIGSKLKGIAWEVQLPPRKDLSASQITARSNRPVTNGHSANGLVETSLRFFCEFSLGPSKEVAYVLPVDPAGTAPLASGFLDTFARDVAISYTTGGVLSSWAARVDVDKQRIDWLLTSTVETCVNNPSLASATSIRKAAMVDEDRTSLSIWNTRSAQLEHEERFENQGPIQDLDWASTPDNQSVLAVGFPHKVIIYAQLRYDYLNAGPSWAPIREIQIRDLTRHPIGDSVWLSSGNLVMGAGNQLFIQDEHIEVSDALLPDLRLLSRKTATFDIFTVVGRLNGPLPVYHPQLLSQCILAGKLMLVQKILLLFYKKLKFFVEGDEFDSFLGLSPDDFLSDSETLIQSTKKALHLSYSDFSEDDDEPATITEEIALALNELLTRNQVPLLSSREQFQLADIIECVGTVEKYRRSIDDNAGRFLLFFRQHMRRNTKYATKNDGLSWREITWAYHSGSQDILIDQVSKHFQSKMTWANARDSGMFMWMTDLAALRTQFEVIARNEYTRSEDKNPVDCSLYYFALKKKAVVAGLWRMATWSKEQGATQRLLSNNFQEARWQTAALKNAYALMGRRRFEYAAAFFLLADHLQDAVSVLSNQLGDIQLAIAVARVYEGDNGVVLTRFLKEKVLPQAVAEGNRWLATWAFWMISKKDSAVRALVTPLSSLLSPPETPNIQSKLFLADDPALIVLYKQLREKSLQALRGAIMVTPKAEWELVIHTAQLYDRMGCDLLALDLVRTWEFLLPAITAPPKLASSPSSKRVPQISISTIEAYRLDPRKLLRRRSSLVSADLPSPEMIRSALFEQESTEESAHGASSASDKPGLEKITEEKKKPTMFYEPEANSLLDSFGF